MSVGVVGTSSRTPDSGPGLVFPARLPPSSAAGHGQLILEPEKSLIQTGGIVLLCCLPFRQQNLCEVNVACAEPLLKPMAGKADIESLVLYHSLETGLSLLFCPFCLCFASWFPLKLCVFEKLTFLDAGHSLPFRSLGVSYLTRNRENSSAPRSSSKSTCSEVLGGKTA